MSEIDALAERLAFVGSTSAAYQIAISMQGAENPKAAAAVFGRAWRQKEAALKRELEGERRSKKAGGTTLTKADIMAIKDAGERQAAIADNIELFLNHERQTVYPWR